MNHSVTPIVFTLLALIELIADKLPNTPARTAALGLTARIVFGCLGGIATATSTGGSLLAAATGGIAGAVVGTFAGYRIRRYLVLLGRLPDFAVAIAEDMIAVAGSLLIVSHL